MNFSRINYMNVMHPWIELSSKQNKLLGDIKPSTNKNINRKSTLYLEKVPNVDDKSPRDGSNVHPLVLVIDLETTDAVLSEDGHK